MRNFPVLAKKNRETSLSQLLDQDLIHLGFVTPVLMGCEMIRRQRCSACDDGYDEKAG